MRLIMEECCRDGSLKSEQLKEFSEYLKIVSDVNRLQILCLLKKGERCVCNIHEPLGLPQNLVSHHLKALRHAGLVMTRREGKWVYYQINTERISYFTDLYNQIILGGECDADQSIGARLCKLQEARG
ncbi:MAG: metalloregulator ArsR/SmtB family transcription factor [Firmicutes bacterium]|nr:metalloregulator ArsR/SmtB family transcription factor [Bacillota bacterium]